MGGQESKLLLPGAEDFTKSLWLILQEEEGSDQQQREGRRNLITILLVLLKHMFSFFTCIRGCTVMSLISV